MAVASSSENQCHAVVPRTGKRCKQCKMNQQMVRSYSEEIWVRLNRNYDPDFCSFHNLSSKIPQKVTDLNPHQIYHRG